MTTANPFAAAPAQQQAPAAQSPFQQAAPAQEQQAPPQQFQQTPQPTFQAPPQQAAPQQAAPQPSTLSAGDPFADPVGVSSEQIKDMVGSLLLLKPTEYIPSMTTKKGVTDAIRADVAVLDNTQEPGHIARGVLVFQVVLKRELKVVLDGPDTYQIGRLVMGAETDGKSAPYLFQIATDEEKNLARQFLAVTRL